MNELSQFIDAHPWVTFGVFMVAMQLATGLGNLVRIRIGREKRKDGDA